jgi:hypothetical protein
MSSWNRCYTRGICCHRDESAGSATRRPQSGGSTTFIPVGVGFIGSAIAQKCADAALTAAWGKIVAAFKTLTSAAGADLATESPTLGDPTLASTAAR